MKYLDLPGELYVLPPCTWADTYVTNRWVFKHGDFNSTSRSHAQTYQWDMYVPILCPFVSICKYERLVHCSEEPDGWTWILSSKCKWNLDNFSPVLMRNILKKELVCLCRCVSYSPILFLHFPLFHICLCLILCSTPGSAKSCSMVRHKIFHYSISRFISFIHYSYPARPAQDPGRSCAFANHSLPDVWERRKS